MTKEQAEDVCKWLTRLLDGRKLWSAHVSEVRKRAPEDITKYRVVLESAGSERPIAIYSARVLTSAKVNVL